MNSFRQSLLSLLYVRKCHKLQKMSHHVFVYGTLKRNEPNHYWLTSKENGVGKFVCEARTQSKYPLIIATKYNIPFLLYKPGEGHNVVGEIYEVDDLMLSKLDILEGHPDYYVREVDKFEVTSNDTKDKTKECWVYFIKKFKPHLLTMPFLKDYKSKGPHGLPYLERSKRDPTYDYKLKPMTPPLKIWTMYQPKSDMKGTYIHFDGGTSRRHTKKFKLSYRLVEKWNNIINNITIY